MTDQAQKPKKEPPQRRLLRSSDDRMLAGVAGGIANYLHIDPTFVRLGFAAAALFGLGIGVLAYLVMAVVVPEDDGSGRPVSGRPAVWAIILLAIAALVILPSPFFGWGEGFWAFGFGTLWLLALVAIGALAYRAWRGEWPGQRRDESASAESRGMAKASGSSAAKKKAASSASSEATTEVRAPRGDGTGQRIVRLLAIVLLAFCAFCLAVSIAGVGAFAAATGNGEIVAGVVVALGIVLAWVALVGDAFRRTAPWLLGLALLLALPAGAVAAADVRFDGGVGEQSYTPVSVTEIPDDGYELGVGQMKVDLRSLDLKRGETLELPAKLGLGQLIVSVPSDVCVTGHAEAKGGDLLVRGVSNSGASAEFERGPAPGVGLPRVDIDVELQFGQLVVTDQAPDDYDHGNGPGPGRDDAGDELAPLPEACLG
jgi:phage shock protein PspC (stress-responsive transcriptional regulator)